MFGRAACQVSSHELDVAILVDGPLVFNRSLKVQGLPVPPITYSLEAASAALRGTARKAVGNWITGRVKGGSRSFRQQAGAPCLLLRDTY